MSMSARCDGISAKIFRHVCARIVVAGGVCCCVVGSRPAAGRCEEGRCVIRSACVSHFQTSGLSHCLCRPSLVDVPALLLAATKCTRFCATANCASCRLKIDCCFSATDDVTTNTNRGDGSSIYSRAAENIAVPWERAYVMPLSGGKSLRPGREGV